MTSINHSGNRVCFFTTMTCQTRRVIVPVAVVAIIVPIPDLISRKNNQNYNMVRSSSSTGSWMACRSCLTHIQVQI